MKFTLLIVMLLSLLALPGCSTGQAEVTFHSPQASKSVYERFPGAYITSNRDGEYDIILVNDTLRSAGQESSKKPLQPVTQPPLQQAIHIHVFWRPVEGAMIKESSITNAIVHWYVFSGEGSRGTDMLHYQGAAFVMLDAKRDTARIIIGDGQIAPRLIKGGIHDPIGPSKITGTALAIRNDARVRELLASFQEKASGSNPFWTEAENDVTPAVAK